jgi:hypothetical protein
MCLMCALHNDLITSCTNSTASLELSNYTYFGSTSIAPRACICKERRAMASKLGGRIVLCQTLVCYATVLRSHAILHCVLCCALSHYTNLC